MRILDALTGRECANERIEDIDRLIDFMFWLLPGRVLHTQFNARLPGSA